MNSTTRTVLATVALIAATLTLGAAPAAATTADQHTGACHSLSSGYKTWSGFQTEKLDCGHAHNLGRAWASRCGRSSSPTTSMHCTIDETVAGHLSVFNCGNTKNTHTTQSYHVHCHDPNGRKVSFTFYGYGL